MRTLYDRCQDVRSRLRQPGPVWVAGGRLDGYDGGLPPALGLCPPTCWWSEEAGAGSPLPRQPPLPDPGGKVLASTGTSTPRYNLSWNEVGSMELQLSSVPPGGTDPGGAENSRLHQHQHRQLPLPDHRAAGSAAETCPTPPSLCPPRGLPGPKALKARVLEQATGPAVKMVEAPSAREASFSPPPGWSSSRPAWEKRRPTASPRRPLTQAVQAILAARRSGSTEERLRRPGPCSTSACGGWGCR